MSNAALALGRLALAAIFLVSGYGKLVGLAGTAAYIGSKGLPVPMVLAVLAGVGEVVLGAAIVLGFKARLAALGLVAFTAIATALFHDFWNLQGAARGEQQIHALKNLAMIGGLLVLAGAGAGRFSVDRR
ncbi:MAG TPA: DoxX family protein [Microvirga sp.]|jgi:putative oxidoreductase|nr:DoxX family protein [Microvirga sp.]